MACLHACFLRLRWWGVLIGGSLFLGSLIGTEAVHAQALDAALRQQVERDLRGDDLREKDGPLAKMGTHLALIYREHERHRRRKAGRPFRPSRYARSVDGEDVAIDAIAAGRASALRAQLEQLGLRQAATAGRLVSGYLPIRAIPEAARLDALRGAYVAVARMRAGATTTQGDGALQADAARDTFNVDGSGVAVGVLSDSYDTNPDAATSAREDIASGDLPADINVLQEGAEGSDEGRAMMQIIHDVAPGADLAFHSALGGQANFAQAIHNLAGATMDADAVVLVDDIFYLTEPMFQDGVVAQAIDAVAEGGVAYVTAAGNSNRESYASPFRSSGQTGPGGGTLHDFDAGAATDTRQQITIPEGDSVQISFQWVDPYASTGGAGADSDVDIYLLDGSGTVVAQSDLNNLGSDPIEFLEYKNAGDDAPGQTFDLAIELFDGPPPEEVKYIYYAGDASPEDEETVRLDEHTTESPTIFGHSNAAGASTVGAVFWFATPAFADAFDNPFAVNAYSSVGGVPIYFRPDGVPRAVPEVREKPNVTGPDAGNTTFFGQLLRDGETGEPLDQFPNFFGTSAAAPHVAGVAALMLGYDPARAPRQLYADLERTALDMTTYLTEEGDVLTPEPIPNGEGFDFFSGYGLVQADAAVPNYAEVTALSASEEQGQIQLTWTETPQADVVRYVVERRYFEGPFEAVATVPSLGSLEAHDYVADELGLGLYTFRLRMERSDGSDEVLPLRAAATVGLNSFAAEQGGDEDDVQLTWTVPEAMPDSLNYRYIVQQRTDRGFTSIDTTTAQSYTLGGLQPGAYGFRLVMEDEAGNAFASEAVSVQIALEGEIALGAPYPNPFVDRVRFPVTLAAAEFVTIRVYNALGQLVQLFGQQIEANVPSTVVIEPDPAWASGVYFVQIEGEDFTENRQAVFVR